MLSSTAGARAGEERFVLHLTTLYRSPPLISVLKPLFTTPSPPTTCGRGGGKDSRDPKTAAGAGWWRNPLQSLPCSSPLCTTHHHSISLPTPPPPPSHQLDVEAKTAEIQKLQQELEGAMRKVDEAHAETLAAKAEIQVAKAETQAAKAEIIVAKAETQTAKAETQAAKAEIQVAKAETQTAKAETRAAMAETQAAKAETQATKAEAQTAKAETERLCFLIGNSGGGGEGGDWEEGAAAGGDAGGAPEGAGAVRAVSECWARPNPPDHPTPFPTFPSPRSQMLHPPESRRDTPATPNEMESEWLKHLSDCQTKDQEALRCPNQQDREALLQVIVSELGFDNGRPVVACVTYKARLHWRSFEAERTSVFDRIIQTIGGAIENQQSNERLAYWLANTSCLLFLLQRTLKASGAPGSQAQSTQFDFMSQSFQGCPATHTGMVGASGGLEHIPQVEAKHPALLLKQQLMAYVEKTNGMIRDNVKKEILPTLCECNCALCISRAAYGRHSSHRGVPVATATHALSSHWGSIIATLTTLLTTLKASHVPSFLVRKLVTQIFSFINVQLFNSLLLRRECCSFSNGEYVKAGPDDLDHWLHEATPEYTGNAWEEIKYIRQSVGFLRRMSDENSASVSISFLLDDDSSIPFSVEDISKSTHETDLRSLQLPPAIRDNNTFQFLLTP
ncbi:unnamed protein product [Closterium sp. NIES-54]